MAARRIPSRGSAERNRKPVAGLVDEMVSRYEAWSEDAAAVAGAHGRWSEAGAAEEAERFAAYMAALDQEQASAWAYARAVIAVERWTPRARRAPDG